MARGKQRKGGGGAAGAGATGSTQAMAEAWRLFEAGDKHLARTRAKAVLAGTPTEAEATEANDLIERTRLPRLPLIVSALLATVTLLLILLAVIRY